MVFRYCQVVVSTCDDQPTLGPCSIFATPGMETSEDVVKNCFHKEIVLKSNHCDLYKLLTLDSKSIFATHPWSIPSFLTLENQLNDVKSRLNDFDIRAWQRHTSYTNLAYDVVAQLKQVCHPELCTQAWAKFYEIIHRCQLDKCLNLPDWYRHPESSQRTIATLHLCEGPGAFITGLNHYLKSYYPQLSWRWLATTLNPYYEGNRDGSTIADDRIICKTLPHWNFGRDNSGNILHRHNMTYLIESLKEWPPIYLVSNRYLPSL